jgi:hypothetical protein
VRLSDLWGRVRRAVDGGWVPSATRDRAELDRIPDTVPLSPAGWAATADWGAAATAELAPARSRPARYKPKHAVKVRASYIEAT